MYVYGIMVVLVITCQLVITCMTGLFRRSSKKIPRSTVKLGAMLQPYRE